MKEINEIKSKISILNKAAKAYYQEGKEVMSNFEYDKIYDELVELEKKIGVVLANSPTQNVGYEVMTELPKEAHKTKMLSLDKTKSIDALIEFAGEQNCLLSWKLDGLTVVLTYNKGELKKAVTRGNGEIGEVITNNAKVFANIPVSIPYMEELTLRGEAIITYSDFQKINEQIPEIDAKYKNPRNLCSGSVRQLNNEITAKRNVRFVAFSMVGGKEKTRQQQHNFLEKLGFEVVEYKLVNKKSMKENVEYFASHIEKSDYPSDGLVLTYDDIEYGNSLGITAKFPRDSLAFKWQDEVRESKLKKIQWSVSRTGLINPIAVFEPVELEGTTVTRASVHNVSILKELHLGIGDRIEVYKANMIIPQIARNNTCSDNIEIPQNCPVCNGETKIKNDNGVESLYCTNPKCPAKKIKAFVLFVSRDALNIEGLSQSTIEKLLNVGVIKEPVDFFKLNEHKDAIKELEGFGEKSFDNLMNAVNVARETSCSRLLYSLGIPGIGVANAKVIARYCDNDFYKVQRLTKSDLLEIEGIGDIMAEAFVKFFLEEENIKKINELLPELKIEKGVLKEEQIFNGMTFVITGSLNHFENRNQLKELIENKGGKVAGTVSTKTSFLINNEANSNSSKNKKAEELGIEIITENIFMEKFGVENA